MTKRLEQLRSFLESSPNEPFILFAVAKEYEGNKQNDKALEYYYLLMKNHPDYVGTYYHLGKLLEQTNAFKEAFETYVKGMAVAQKIGDRHSLSELAGAKMELGDEDDFF
jgi:tetratricopeptide (TPR) repeat protein